MKQIPFLDLRKINLQYRQQFRKAFDSVLESGWYIGGSHVSSFEKEFAEYCVERHCVSVGNGFDALRIALQSLDLTPADEVIVPAQTFIATWMAVTSVGAKIVQVDVTSDNCLLDIQKTLNAITSKTKVIIPVHLYGYPFNTLELRKLLPRKDITIVADCAQAHGAKLNNLSITEGADINCWSFYPGKTLGALGDAGAITTNDEKLASRCRMISNYGAKTKYVHETMGVNSRLDAMQALFLSTKLKNLDSDCNERRRQIDIYNQNIVNEKITKIAIPENVIHGGHLYVVRVEDRTNFIKYMHDNNVETGIHYPSTPNQNNAYQHILSREKCDIAQEWSKTCVSLPLGQHLGAAELEQIIGVVNKW